MAKNQIQFISTDSDSIDNPYVILFHGYGADCNDLAVLPDYMPAARHFNWIFPNGILEVPIGMGWTGRAWWPVDFNRLHEDMAEFTPANLNQVADLCFSMIEKLNIPWSNIILGGFSQGSMLATHLYLNAPKIPRGLVILSGSLINKNEWKPLLEKRAGESFFQSHGEEDQILPIRGASKLETFLTQNGMKGRLVRFAGGHEIPDLVLTKLNDYLTSKK